MCRLTYLRAVFYLAAFTLQERLGTATLTEWTMGVIMSKVLCKDLKVVKAYLQLIALVDKSLAENGQGLLTGVIIPPLSARAFRNINFPDNDKIVLGGVHHKLWP